MYRFKITVFTMIVIVLFAATASMVYAKQDKYTICHIEDVYQVDDAGELVLDDDGEAIVIDTVTESKTLPAGAIRAHDNHEADHMPDTYTVGEVLDEDGNVVEAGVAVLSCTPVLDDEGNELTPTALGSTDLVEALEIPDKGKGKDKGKAEKTDNTPDNIADVLHPNIHQNNGAGQNANPNGANDGGGNLHGISNIPGQSDNEPGVANLANVHGGIGAVNKNVE